MQVLPVPVMTLHESKVVRALDQLDQHNAAPINSLAAEIETYTDDVLIPVLRRLTDEMNRLDSTLVTPFVGAILRIRLSGRSSQFKSIYTHFLSLLTSLNPKWWTDVAHKIVADFVCSPELTKSHHDLVSRIFRLVPTSQQKFQRILGRHFPYKNDSAENTLNYVKNLLNILDYAPEMQGAVWGIIMERIMQLDVECDDNEDDDSDSEDEDAMDIDDLEDGAELTDAQIAALQSNSLKEIHDKLDLIMVYLLGYLEEKFSANAIEENIPLFITLLDKFKEFVVPTHTTRCVQFLIFRIVHCHPDLMDAFLVALIDMAVDPLLRIEKRQKAMQYISSFVARAKGLSRDQIVKVISYLSQWLSRYIIEREHEVDETPNMSRFRMFYATSQALFYIFCFRHSMLMVPGSDSQWESGIDKLFQRAIITKFNPLKYCKSTVTYKFARLAQRYNVAYCFSIIEQNRVGRFRSQAVNAPSKIGSVIWPNHKEFATLESYFPFDPLSLRKTTSLISHIYIQWDDVNDDESDSDSYDSSEDEIEDEIEDDMEEEEVDDELNDDETSGEDDSSDEEDD